MMSESIKCEVYNKAPIVEAVMDINVQFAEGVDISKLNALADKLEGYPTKENIFIARAQVNINHALSQTKHSSDQLGIRLISEDKKYVIQIKKTGFTFSRVNGYESWEIFQSKAKDLWELYFNNLNPIKITRIGLRYINRINIPALNFNLEEYFETYPKVFSGNNGNLSGFFLQLQVPQPDDNIAILNQTITSPLEPGYTSVLFDIDVLDRKHLDANNQEELWNRFQLLRMQKNKLFDDSITNKTKELFS